MSPTSLKLRETVRSMGSNRDIQTNEPPTALFSLESGIDRRPLTVAPDTQLIDAIAVMGKAKASCVVPSLNIPIDSMFMSQARASCLLVVEGAQLIGMLTESDVIQLIASGRNLAGVKIAEVMTQPASTLTLSDSQEIFAALSLLRQHQIRHLPILSVQGQLVGIVTPESIRQVLQPADLLKSRRLAEVIITPVIHAPLTASALTLARLMAHQGSCVVIVETDSENGILPVGIVTQSDLVQLQALELDLSQILAQTVMSTPLLCFSPSELALVAQWEMQQQRVQQSVVSRTGESRLARAEDLLGIVTVTSFLQTLDLTDMSRAVEQLQDSIDQFAAQKAETDYSVTDLESPAQSSPKHLLEQLELNRLSNAITLRIRESLHLDEIVNTAVTEVREFLQTDRVIIYRFNPDFSGIVVVESVAAGWQPILGCQVQDSCFGKDYAQSYKEGRIQVTEDIYTAGLTQCHIDILTLFDIRANLVVPILQGEHLWGLLCAYHCSGPRRWRQLEVDLLKQLANQVSIALAQAQLLEALQESEKKYRSVVDNISEVIFQTDAAGLWTFLNPAWTEITGFALNESIGKNFLEFIHPDARQSNLELFQLLIQRQEYSCQYETQYLTKDDSFRWIEVKARLTLAANDTITGTSGTLNDITERKQAEAEIRKTLEKEKELSQLKSGFITTTSHEFRTPLSIISSSTGLIKDYGNKLDEVKKQKHLQRIQSSVTYMTELLEDLLLINRAEAGKLEFKPDSLDLVKFCRNLVEELQLGIRTNHKIVLQTDIATSVNTNVYIDEKLLRQILSNLLSNAIKYSPQGCAVYLNIAFQNGMIVFQIKDEGIGIPPEDQEHLFESFHRAKNVGNISGTGLGLAIVKKCVEVHGGQIAVESEVAVGTTFTVKIPLNLLIVNK